MTNNQTQIFFRKVLGFIAIISIGSPLNLTDARAQSKPVLKGIGKVSIIHPSVKIIRKKKKVTVKRVGTLLLNNDEIKTGKKGKANITLFSGDKVTMAPYSRLTVIKGRVEKSPTLLNKIVLRMFSGKMRVLAKKGKKRRLFVRTPSALIKIKGTDFIVDYQNKITTVGTLEGLVNMYSTRTNQAIDIPVGKMAVINLSGTILTLKDITGELMTNVEFAGEKMENDDISGGKIKL